MTLELRHHDYPAQPAYRNHTARLMHQTPLTLRTLKRLVRESTDCGIPDTATVSIGSMDLTLSWQSYPEPWESSGGG